MIPNDLVIVVEFHPIAAIIFTTIFILVMAAALVCYVFESIALFTIAKRRGVQNYGLAWVPVGNLYVIGCLADGFDNATKGKNTNLRGVLTWLGIGTFCALLTFILAPLAVAAFFVIAVFYYIALFKVYNSCKDKDNTVLFVLSMMVPGVASFLLFSMRNNDDGFPFIKRKMAQAEANVPAQPSANQQFAAPEQNEMPPYIDYYPVFRENDHLVPKAPPNYEKATQDNVPPIYEPAPISVDVPPIYEPPTTADVQTCEEKSETDTVSPAEETEQGENCDKPGPLQKPKSE